MKFAAIDIGSNAIRLLIEEVWRDSSTQLHIEKISLTRVPLRLGDDVFTNGKISKEKIQQLVKTMKAFWLLMEVHGVVWYRACATSAMRETKNKNQIIARIKHETGIAIDILSGDEEANLIFSNYMTQHLREENYLYIDVGGGSTELIFLQNGKKISGKSFEIGAVRMLTGMVKNKTWEKVEHWITKTIQNKKITAIGSGGNINSLFKLQGKKNGDGITKREIEQQYQLLRSLTPQERMNNLHIKPDRADVIVPAIEIYLHLFDLARIEKIIVPKIGLPDGIILDIVNHRVTLP